MRLPHPTTRARTLRAAAVARLGALLARHAQDIERLGVLPPAGP
jgi:hypothetical protein